MPTLPLLAGQALAFFMVANEQLLIVSFFDGRGKYDFVPQPMKRRVPEHFCNTLNLMMEKDLIEPSLPWRPCPLRLTDKGIRKLVSHPQRDTLRKLDKVGCGFRYRNGVWALPEPLRPKQIEALQKKRLVSYENVMEKTIFDEPHHVTRVTCSEAGKRLVMLMDKYHLY